MCLLLEGHLNVFKCVHCCRLGCISTSKVWETRMPGQDIGRIGIHVRCFLYHCLAHQTTTETIWIGWIWVSLPWPHMESTVRHIRLSGSTFSLDGPDTETAQWNICQSGFIVSLGGFRPYRDISVRLHLLRLIWGEISLRFQHALDHALTPEQLGQRAVHGVEATNGYIEWFYLHSHPRMILPDIPVPADATWAWGPWCASCSGGWRCWVPTT